MSKKRQRKTEKKRIVPLVGAGKELMKKFECSADLVSRALNFKSNSLKAHVIRQYALDYLEGQVITYMEEEAKSEKKNKKSKKE